MKQSSRAQRGAAPQWAQEVLPFVNRDQWIQVGAKILGKSRGLS